MQMAASSGEAGDISVSEGNVQYTDEATDPIAGASAGEANEEQTQPEPGDPNNDPRIFNDDKLGHMCIVLSPAVRRQLMRGEPLIVGTSTASVESFFQRLISVCQVGAHMPVMFQTLGGAVTVANIKKKKAGIMTKLPIDRYPMPMPPPKTTKPAKRNREAYPLIPEAELLAANAEEFEVMPDGLPTEGVLEPPRRKKVKFDRDEIPIEAVREYLTHQNYFPGWNANAKRNLRKRCRDFRLDPDGVLNYIGRKGYVIPVVEDRAQRVNLIWELHIIDHKRRDGLLTMLRSKYYWKGMFYDVTRVLDSCKVCSATRLVRDQNREAWDASMAAAQVEDDGDTNDEEIYAQAATRYRDGSQFPPALPDLTEKYPETSEVPIGAIAGMD